MEMRDEHYILGQIVEFDDTFFGAIIKGARGRKKSILPAYVSRRAEIHFICVACPTARKRAIAVLTEAFHD